MNYTVFAYFFFFWGGGAGGGGGGGSKQKALASALPHQCCREITFILNRLYRDISRYEHLIAEINIVIYLIIHDQLSLGYCRDNIECWGE